MGFFSKDKNKYLHGFAKTNDSLGKKLRFVTENKKQNKEDFMEQLMVTLIEADIGYRTSELICDKFFEWLSQIFFSLELLRSLKSNRAVLVYAIICIPNFLQYSRKSISVNKGCNSTSLIIGRIIP